MPDIAIRHLRYFLVVAESANFTRAAERLGVTQPAISQQVRDLERALGTPLFRRGSRHVQLTTAGRAFTRHATVLLRKLQDAVDELAQVEGAISGHLELGVVPALHVAWVPRVIRRMTGAFPGVTVAVHECASKGVETEVEAGRWDLGLAIGAHPSPALRFERLLAQDVALIVPTGHPLGERMAVSPRDLAALPLVLLPPTFDLRTAIDDLFRRTKVRPNVVCEINTIDSTLATVLAAGLATILPPVVLEGRGPLSLSTVPVTGRAGRIEFGLFTMRDAEPTPPAREFVRLLREELAAAPGARAPARR